MGSLPTFDLDGFLPYRLTVAAERLSTELARRYRDRFGITMPEWRILVHVAQAGPLSVRDIERRANLEKSKVSRAAARLVAKGYLSKAANDRDRRLVTLALTRAGEVLMAELLPLAIAFQADLERRVGKRMAALEAALDALGGDDP